MKIVVIDGQGGKMGSLVVKGILERCPGHDIYAVGTNGIATGAMLKAGAKYGATGENPVIYNSKNADLIIGPIGIMVADAILGEVTEKMAIAVGSSEAQKILIPATSCGITIAGLESDTLAEYVKKAVALACESIEKSL